MQVTRGTVHDGPDTNWQFVVKTHDGKCFCRETIGGRWSEREACDLLEGMIKHSPHRSLIAGYKIERW